MPTGIMTTYDLTTGVMLDFEDFVYIMSPKDVPFLGTFNGLELPAGQPRSVLPVESGTEKKIEWQDEELLTPRTTLGATLVTADTFMTVAAGERERFATGDLVLIDDEYIRITGYGTTADTLTITKNWNSTGTSAQHSNAKVVIGVGTTLDEGSDAEKARAKDRTARHNFMEIFGPYKVSVSETERTIRKYGVSDEFLHQTDNRLAELNIGREQTIIYGVRSEDTTNKRRAMGGFDFYITTNKDTTTTDLTESKLLDLFEDSYDNGGAVDLLAVNATQKRKISGFNVAQIRLDRDDQRRGAVVSTFENDFSVAGVLLNRWVRSADLFGLDMQWIARSVLRGVKGVPLAKTGDADNAHVVCEESLKVRLEKRHFKFKALA